ncbi:MAG: molecular chaperone DnaJ [Chloroflexi bacterium]|nr:molecular chaperone DnaJ [Chloroflexota bacterium]
MAENKRDYYEVLGIPRDAGKEDIRSAYRRLARQYHPDVSKEPDAAARFKEINEAYQVLNDDEKRSQYDRFGHQAFAQGNGGQGFGGFDMGGFGSIFEDFFGFGQRTGKPGPNRGTDLRYDLEITFEEAVFGKKHELNIRRMETCPSCHGSGAEPGTSPIRCPDCNGSGQVRHSQQSIFGAFVNVTTCPRCGGRGETISTPCTTCHGTTKVEQERTIQVDIPAGVDDETRIRLSGEGEPGAFGGPPGNLYVVLHVKPHAYFTRRENDILLNMNINITQAALGAEIEVPTLEGTDKIKIPAGTQTGTVFKLRGKGIPYLQRRDRGDEVIIINIQIPTNLDSSQKQLFKELGKTLGTESIAGEEKGILNRIKDALGL